jgi:hypothetical protein
LKVGRTIVEAEVDRMVAFARDAATAVSVV